MPRRIHRKITEGKFSGKFLEEDPEEIPGKFQAKIHEGNATREGIPARTPEETIRRIPEKTPWEKPYKNCKLNPMGGIVGENPYSNVWVNL